MEISREAMDIIAKLTATLCEQRLDEMLVYNTEIAGKVFGDLLSAYWNAKPITQQDIAEADAWDLAQMEQSLARMHAAMYAKEAQGNG
jgi:hypothetical protein